MYDDENCMNEIG
ncbi:hypothetical protein RB213_005854 [Colletotrichum asianum]